jgi:integrase
MLAMYTGQRRSDIIKMKWADFDQGAAKRRATIKVVQQKTGEKITMAVHKQLLAFLRGINDCESEFILTNQWGRPFTASSITCAVKDQLIANEDKKYTLRGLRKNAGIALAEAGASVPQIMAVLGHKTPTMAIYYVREANKAKLNSAAVDLWEKAA